LKDFYFRKSARRRRENMEEASERERKGDIPATQVEIFTLGRVQEEDRKYGEREKAR
jgi:hypothetical protein